MLLVQCSTSWLESVCFIILAKEIINAKIESKWKTIKFNYVFLLWGIGAGGKQQVPPVLTKFKKLDFQHRKIKYSSKWLSFFISFHFFFLSVLKTGQFFWSINKTCPPLSGSLLFICQLNACLDTIQKCFIFLQIV